MVAKAHKKNGKNGKKIKPLSTEFGRCVRDLRIKRGLTYAALQELSGVSQSYLSDVEKGFCVPGIDKAQKIAQALDSSLAEIISAGEKK